MKAKARLDGYEIEADLVAERESSFIVPEGMRGDMVIYFKMKKEGEVVDEEIVVLDVRKMNVLGEEMMVFDGRKNAFGETIPLGTFALCSRCGIPLYTSTNPELNLGSSFWVDEEGKIFDGRGRIEGEVVFCPKCKKKLGLAEED